jgi:hypothetical protein
VTNKTAMQTTTIVVTGFIKNKFPLSTVFAVTSPLIDLSYPILKDSAALVIADKYNEIIPIKASETLIKENLTKKLWCMREMPFLF